MIKLTSILPHPATPPSPFREVSPPMLFHSMESLFSIDILWLSLSDRRGNEGEVELISNAHPLTLEIILSLPNEKIAISQNVPNFCH